ncbi:ribonuclease H-like domain-containing protein [Tanacetum coccineum]
MWLFRHKYLANGTLSRYKARLVANDSTQLERVDVDEKFSPVIKLDTIRTVLIYTHQPPGFRDSKHPDYGIDTAYLLLYVDDIVVTASSKSLLQAWMFLSQRKYATEILERAHMVSCNSSRTPVDTESKLGDDGDQFSRFAFICNDPWESHLSALKRILRYVCGTLNYGLQLFSSSTTDLVAYSDADWAGCPTTCRLTSGYYIFLGNKLLSWSSKHQSTLSRSSAEVEYRGVANAVAETRWLRNLLRELQTLLPFATLVYNDNVSVVYLSSNLIQHQRTKHIEIDIHFVRDLVIAGEVRVLHVSSPYQYANFFTKGLPSTLFEEFHTSLSVRCPAREC